MKVWVFMLLFPLLCAVSSTALARLAITGNILIEPDPSLLLRGQSATITYTITNTGDEPLDEATSGFLYYDWGPTSTLYSEGTAATPPCTYNFLDFSPVPGNPPLVGLTLFYRPLPVLPGESRQCVMELTVSEETAGPFIQRFGFTGIRGDRSTSTSQSFFFSLGTGGNPIPTLSLAGLGLLCLAVFAIGLMLAPRGKRFGA